MTAHFAAEVALKRSYLCVTRARMHEILRAGRVARTAETPSTNLAAALVTKTINGPLSGPKRQKPPDSSREGPRALDARRRRSPDPTDTLAHRNSPRAGPRSLPSPAWIGFALLYCRLPEKGTKLKPWDAAMIKNKKMGMSDDAPTQGYPVVPVTPRFALPIARASDGHQKRRIGDRHFELDLT